MFAGDFAIPVAVRLSRPALLMVLSLVPRPTASSRRDRMATNGVNARGPAAARPIGQ